MGLDINTPKGREHAQQQRDAANIVFGKGPNTFHHTKTDDSAILDGFICDKNGDVVGVAEIKSRPNMTTEQLFGEFEGEWLVTLSKTDFLCSGSVLFSVPGYGMLYIPKEKKVYMVKICDDTGLYCCQIRHRYTETQATCNGGTAYRDNAFIQMRDAKVFT